MKKTILILILLFPSVLISQDLKYWFPEKFEENTIPESRIALIIANTDYNDDKYDLKNPINDANLIAQTLYSLDFEVIFKKDLNRMQAEETIIEFQKKHSEYDFSIIYYAGHAFQDKNGNSFLIPIDFSNEVSFNDAGISLSGLLGFFESSPTLLILDACRETNNNGLSKPLIQDPLNVKLAYPTSFGKTASDNSDYDNTAYTSYLSRLFLMKGLTINDILHNTAKLILKQSEGKQYPVDYFGISVEDIQLSKVVD